MRIVRKKLHGEQNVEFLKFTAAGTYIYRWAAVSIRVQE